MLYNMLKQEAFIHDDGWSSTPSNHHAYNPSQILVHIRVCLKISTQFNSKKMVFFFFLLMPVYVDTTQNRICVISELRLFRS